MKKFLTKKLLIYGSIFLVILTILVLAWKVGVGTKQKAAISEFFGATETGSVRQPAVAGQFYPADSQELKDMVDGFLERANLSSTKGQIFGLVEPHAGYPFSAQVAAYGYKILEGMHIDTVILIGPSHHEYFEGASIYPKGYYETPLGKVKINTSLAQKIMEQSDGIRFRESAHLKEHSLEVQLPFLQKVLANFKIVPILIGSADPEFYKILAQALVNSIGNENVLFIASSDLSHYPSYEDAKYADSKTIKAILSGRVSELQQTIDQLKMERIPNTVTFACGEDAIKTLMLVAKKMGAQEVKLLDYANSGDVVVGNKSRVVGYAAIGFFKKALHLDSENILNRQQQQKLLAIAKSSVETFVRKGTVPVFKVDDPVLNQHLGAFVTLKEHGRLRGCIGRFSPVSAPLYKVVSEMAIAAATQDARFPPVQVYELDNLNYEISVLSSLKPIDDWRKVKLGKHGVQVQKGLSRGVFLPQVAVDMADELHLKLNSPELFNRFMNELCSQKAHLQPNCWRQPNTQLYIFTAQVF